MYFRTSLYAFVLVCSVLFAVGARPGFFKYNNFVRDPQYEYQTKYITQNIDHFGFPNPGTYQMRFLVSDKFWNKTDGPIFFYAGNEGDITAFANNTGFMWDIAPNFQALLIFAEHRYYGQSLPFGNSSYKDADHLRYFTSEQALADYAVLLRTLENLVRHPVIVFGGSYGGMLAAWFRMKYPHLVAGAIAGSAPIWQFPGLTDCGVFNKIVTQDFASANQNCASNIRKSWSVLNKFSKTGPGRRFLTETMRLCQPLIDEANITNVKTWLLNIYGNLAMVNYPYETSFLEPLPAWPVTVFCSHLSLDYYDDDDMVRALTRGLNVYFNYTGTTTCLDVNSQSAGSLDDMGWDYQACTEMVLPMCADGVNDMFEPYVWDFQAYSKACQQKWKVVPDDDWVTTHYGDRHITAASNIVFSNGNLDPWSGGGVLETLSPSLPAIRIPMAAHHLDLRGANPSDSTYVRAARQQHIAYIKQWIGEPQAGLEPDTTLRFTSKLGKTPRLNEH